MKKDIKKQKEEADDTLKDMIKNLNELPIEVLEQLKKNLDEIEEYNKKHNIN